MKKQQSFLRRNLVTIMFVGLIVSFVGVGSAPMLRHPPGHDDQGYYLVGKEGEQVYSEQVRDLYFKHRLWGYVAVFGLVGPVVLSVVVLGREWWNKRREKPAP